MVQSDTPKTSSACPLMVCTASELYFICQQCSTSIRNTAAPVSTKQTNAFPFTRIFLFLAPLLTNPTTRSEAANGGGSNWEMELPMILLVHRASSQGTSKKSFQLMYERRPWLPGNNMTWPQPQKWNDRKWKEERKQKVRNVQRKQRMGIKWSEQHQGR